MTTNKRFDIKNILINLPVNHQHLIIKEKEISREYIVRVDVYSIYNSNASECYLPCKPISKMIQNGEKSI